MNAHPPTKTQIEAGEPAGPERGKTPRPIAVYVVFAAILLVVLQAYSMLSPILLSFLLIILITLAVNPVIMTLLRWSGGRKSAMTLFMFGILALGGLTIWASIAPIKEAGSTLTEKWPEYWERLQKPLIKMEQKNVISQEKLQQEVSEEIARESPDTEGTEEAPVASPVAVPAPPVTAELEPKKGNGENTLRSSIGGLVKNALDRASGLALNTTGILVVLVTTFFGVIFTLLNPRPIFGAMFSVIPERHHDQTLAIMMRTASVVPRWAGAMLISMLSIGLLVFLLMWPILGFTNALVLGLIAGLLEAIPFLGPILAAIPALLLALGIGGMTPLWVLIAYIVVQALESNVIMPMVMSRGMQLHPLAVIFSMLLSIAAFGVLGVLIATPLLVIFGIVHEEIYRKRFLPSVTDDDLNRLARRALLDNRIG